MLPHFAALRVSGRWLSSSILTTGQGRGSHQADKKRLSFSARKWFAQGSRGSEQAVLETTQAQSGASGRTRSPSPQPRLSLQVQPQKAAAPAWALRAYPDSGFVWQHNSLPCEKAWPTHRQLEVTLTPDDTVQSLLCLAFWFLIDIRWRVEINARLSTMLTRSDYSQGKTFQNNKQNKTKPPKRWCAYGTE